MKKPLKLVTNLTELVTRKLKLLQMCGIELFARSLKTYFSKQNKQIKFPSAQIQRKRRISGQRERARGVKGRKNRSVCRRFTKGRNSCLHYSKAISRWLRLERDLSRLGVASCIVMSSPWRCSRISHSWDFSFRLRKMISQLHRHP